MTTDAVVPLASSSVARLAIGFSKPDALRRPESTEEELLGFFSPASNPILSEVRLAQAARLYRGRAIGRPLVVVFLSLHFPDVVVNL